MANAVPLCPLALLPSFSASPATKLGNLNASSSLAFSIPNPHQKTQVVFTPFEGLRCNTGLGTITVQQSVRKLQAEGRIRPVTVTATSSTSEKQNFLCQHSEPVIGINIQNNSVFDVLPCIVELESKKPTVT